MAKIITLITLIMIIIESARILPSPNRVIGQPGMAAYLPCNAAGHPRPKVNWLVKLKSIIFNKLIIN